MRTVAQQRDELTRGSSARVQAFAEWQNEVGNSITVSYLKEHGDRLTKKERATCWALVATPNFPPLVEHEAIMQPDLTYHDPSMYALEEHTGLANHPTPYLITKRIAPCDCGDYFTEGFPLPTATKHMSGGAGITQLERIIMEDCVMTAQGAPCLPHENKKPRPWFTNAGGIKKHYGLSTEQAEKIHESFQLIGPSVAAKSYPQVTDADIMAIHLMANALRECEPTDKDQTWVVLDEGEDDPLGESQELIMQLFDADAELQEAVTPADENIDDVPSPIEYHKLDDPRDEAPTWESRQSAEFHTELNKLRTMNMDELKAWGKSTHSTKKPSTPQMQVLWTEFFLRKAQLTPSIRPYAKAIIDRCQLTPQIGKANFWLYNEGKRTLTPTEQAAAWKVLKARETKRPVQYEIPEIPDNLEESYI